jgi:myo-inositol-1(or 4)-monophosphatase
MTDDECAIGGQEMLLGLATRAALAGAEEVTLPGAITTKSSATDPVTDADRRSEDVIVELIRSHRPQDGIIGEEGGSWTGSSKYRWLIDPLDGTVNFLYKIPAYAVSIACEHFRDGEWTPWVGVVHDIARNETFTAAAGQGAALNGESIKVSAVNELSMALVSTGFSYDSSHRARQGRILCSLLSEVRDIRSGGSAAIELCWVASGRLDAYFEDELAAWDLAAGRLIVMEAGGYTTGYGANGIVAANFQLHKMLQKWLRGV